MSEYKYCLHCESVMFENNRLNLQFVAQVKELDALRQRCEELEKQTKNMTRRLTFFNELINNDELQDKIDDIYQVYELDNIEGVYLDGFQEAITSLIIAYNPYKMDNPQALGGQEEI